MSTFNCDKCGATCLDSEKGYTTGCKHYPPDVYKLGDSVEVNTPSGWEPGKIITTIHNYAGYGETRYSVHGKNLVTIVSARNLRPYINRR